MNKAKDIVEASGKVFIKDLARLLPLGGTAVEIYEELQSKQTERKIQRLEEFYTNLAATVNAQEERINQEYVSKEDFLDVFEEATRHVVLERQEEKRFLYKNILVNSITSPNCDYDKTERYFRLLENLGVLELKVLAILDNPEQYNRSHGMIIKDPINNSYQSTWNTVTSMGVLTQVLGLKVHQVEEAITILFTNGLVIENAMGHKLNTNGNTIHVLKNLLTTRGRDFVNFLKAN